MKHYIFLQRITGSGGVQCYVAAKAKLLEQLGWHVVAISDNNPRNSNEKCLIPYLEKFRLLADSYTSLNPNQVPVFVVKRVLNHLIKVVGNVSEEDEIIVESWNSTSALWGELLAQKLKGKHFIWTANERYRGKGSVYEEKMNFFIFKLGRKELFTGITPANKLFEGYRTVKDGDLRWCIINENPIQDVDNEAVKNISRSDWNICYIGRASKPYVPNVIKGVVTFAQNHPEKNIQFIMVGEASACRKQIDEISIGNLFVTELGDQYPIPRELFRKVDVVIAGSGSARHSADEGVLTIIADSDTYDSRGLLGYDTLNSLSSVNSEDDDEKHYSFSEALEMTLVKERWKSQKYTRKRAPTIEECWANHQLIINEAADNKEYYDTGMLLKGKIAYKAFAKVLINDLKTRLCV